MAMVVLRKKVQVELFKLFGLYSYTIRIRTSSPTDHRRLSRSLHPAECPQSRRPSVSLVAATTADEPESVVGSLLSMMIDQE